ncbi:MAG: MBL fold metallo-hydrolase [Phycisphaerales bacterium]
MNAPASEIPLRIKAYTLGPYATNCYLLWIDGGTDAWIIDASFGPDRIIKDARRKG